MNLRQMEIVTDVDKLKVDLQATFMKYSTIKKWAYIVHDKDDTRPHYHIALHFGGASVDTKQVAKWFNLEYTDENGVEHTGENFINKVKGRWTDVLAYLTHGNDSQKNKHQYDPSEVKANFDFQTEIKNAKILGDFENYSYAQQLNYVHSLPVSEQVSAYRQLDTLWKNHCKWMAMQMDRDISVMFITGRGGTGKTTYAKKIMKERFGNDFCVSSASNDPWQDYGGQKGMILDDARDKVFDNFSDFLKVIDNHTSSSVASRFSNKVFNGELIIITSSVPLRYWYRGRNSNGLSFAVDNEGFEQLYRRIGCYVEVKANMIIVYPDGVDKLGNPQGLGRIYKNTLAEEFNKDQPSKKIDFCSVFDNLCGEIQSPFDPDPKQIQIDGENK